MKLTQEEATQARQSLLDAALTLLEDDYRFREITALSLFNATGSSLLHGLLWTAFHAFKWWDMLRLLPICLVISFSAQRLKNNWPALIAHALFNGLSLLALIAAVVG
jgi:membrane protease YdiL (CAAX protease family)